MNTPPKCLRCQTPMVKGFSIDNTYGAATQTTWNEGEPQPSRILGLATGSVKKDREAVRLPVTQFRCPSCGYLESYALPEHPPQK